MSWATKLIDDTVTEIFEMLGTGEAGIRYWLTRYRGRFADVPYWLVPKLVYKSSSKERPDARGKRKRLMLEHEMLLPHELLGSFSKRSEMLRKLIGDPGVPRLF
ncbi:hypothetical protein AK812_SmicGene22573 [Symbiodinium microadriaticum]|uniref:Uncharacterized protein n=1 Tax=Symbiodinium microadriaticum TaxID=2951 RepID=A0A1Q9DJL2_SYMMI|nr:hypothetical protein AK812_SmicGene22573 [Symbiodinium microadriaticum]CAE7175737.1 unnamed protein product [Symbiodinium microadriaticum]CAE7949713.1 unnamed protein product [Symbiodinium sp. KB8]